MPEKVTEQLQTREASVSKTKSLEREKSPPLTKEERHWFKAVKEEDVNKFASGIVEEIVQEVIAEVIGTVKVEMTMESQEVTRPVGRAQDPEVEAAVASIMISPQSETSGIPIEDIPTGITGTRINLPAVALPGTEDYGDVSPSQLSDSIKRWFREGRPVDLLVVQNIKLPHSYFSLT